MDTTLLISLLTGIMAVFTAALAMMLSYRRRREHELSRMTLEELRFRETQLKYSTTVSARQRKMVLERSMENLKILSELEVSAPTDGARSSREYLYRLRENTQEQIELLLRDSDDDWDDNELGELSYLTSIRNATLRDLSRERGQRSYE